MTNEPLTQISTRGWIPHWFSKECTHPQTLSSSPRDDLKARLRILRRLEYTNEDNVIQTKGRVACEVNTADELLLTELIFNGIFNEMSVEQIVALMSCLVNGEKTTAEFVPKEEFTAALRILYDSCKRVTQVYSVHLFFCGALPGPLCNLKRVKEARQGRSSRAMRVGAM